MPSEMRGRYLMREFFFDVEIQTELNAEERLFLLGMWMLADDSGWLKWDLAFIARQIFPYEDLFKSRKAVEDCFATLVRLKKARRFVCGHVFLPAAEKYKRPGRPAESNQEASLEHFAETNRKRSGNDSVIRHPIPTPDLTYTLPNLDQDPRERARGEGQVTNGTMKEGMQLIRDALPAISKKRPARS